MKSRPLLCLIPGLSIALLCATPLAAAPIASFDVNDAVNGPFTEPGWIPVSGVTDNADTLTGSDGHYTLTLTTSNDGQDRERNAGSFSSNADLWRDFWFVDGNSAVATLSGLEPNTDYSVEIWAYDLASTTLRSADWTDAVTGNSATLAFEGGVTPVPGSLSEGVAVVPARSNGSGVLTLLANKTSALPQGIFVSALRVSTGGASGLVEVEAEEGTLGAGFGTGSIDGAGYIGISTTSSDQTVPSSSARVASYTVTFPEAATYSLYARVRVGPDPFNDDSFFYGNGFGSKSPTLAADWVPQVFTGLANIGFTGPNEVVTAGGGSASNGVWKWLRFDTAFIVNSGSLSQIFQVGGRENGFFMDRFVFASSDLTLTVAELESGIIDPPVNFSGPDGIAIHRFGELNGGRSPDGANPSSGLVLVGGELIGSTLAGGNTGDGGIFRVSVDGGTFATLASFIGDLNGAHPQGDLIESGGVIIGALAGGGANGTGAIFQRAGDGTVTRLYSFAALSEHTASNIGGAVPKGPLATADGIIYGAGTVGGAFGNGVVFSISTAGTGFTVLHQFGELDFRDGTNADGALPNGGVVLAGGRLFGTTMAGGNAGSGVIFSMASDGGDFTVLHHFAALDAGTATNSGGAMPSTGLTVSNGILYGTTLAGGAGGSGSVFAIRTNGADFTSVFAFPAMDPASGINSEGARPAARLLLSGNVLYGVTARGGSGGTGTVFALDTALPDFRTIHAFEPLAADSTNRFGAYPVAPLSHIGPGLYGTTNAGGPGTTGTVFRIPIPISTKVSATREPNHTTNSTFVSRGAPFQTYLIQGSVDLENWDDLVTQPADASGIITVQETGLIAPARFYRLAEP